MLSVKYMYIIQYSFLIYGVGHHFSVTFSYCCQLIILCFLIVYGRRCDVQCSQFNVD